MKKALIIIVALVLHHITASAQTAIEKQTVSSPSAVLDFASDTTKGIILPAVETLPANPVNGTFLFDKTAQVIKMYQNDTWVNLSGTGNASSVVPYSGTVDNGNLTVIGAHSTDADGALVLEGADKALILPKVASPHLTVKSLYAGMMCYDTTKKALAVFDGKVWNYWK